jgi:hypothetical protein
MITRHAFRPGKALVESLTVLNTLLSPRVAAISVFATLWQDRGFRGATTGGVAWTEVIHLGRFVLFVTTIYWARSKTPLNGHFALGYRTLLS